MEPKTIVAIEIASSKIKGGVCSVDPSGKINVLAVEKIAATNNVRHGRVQNVSEVSANINEIIRKLENNPALAGRKIEAVVLPLGGRSMCGIPASASLHFPTDYEIVADTVSRLKQEAIKDFVAPKKIEAIVPRVFYVNNSEVPNPVGNYGQLFRGEFILIASSDENHRNLDRIKIENVSPRNISYLLRPIAVASLVLTDTERQLGCVLVDFGAETTTVSIYKGGALSFLATLPLGSRLITRDLMAGLNLTEERAEEFKTSLGNAVPEQSRTTAENNAQEINKYVQARAGEIAANIVNQIVLSGYKNADLPRGIILVGGGAELKNFDQVLAAQSKLNVRKGSIPPVIDFRSNLDRAAENIDIVALLSEAASDPKIHECLSEPVRDPEPEVHSAATTATAAAAEIAAEKTAHAWHSGSTHTRRRHVPGDDDDDLLEDDPDVIVQPGAPYIADEDEEKDTPRKNKSGIDVFAEEEEEYTPEPEPEPGSVREKLNKISRGIARFFGMPNEPEDGNYRPTDVDDD